jgi:DNA repair exonuclease SbcCD ATPase subunit
MEFFTPTTFITLGIVGMTLILYRRIDRRSQALHKMQQYAAELKTDLSQFVGEKEAAVRDYAISLDVQQKSAKELMRRLQMTDEEFARKAAAVAKIDERLNAYDASLEELVRMTVRVQENLNRIREESGFVEKVNKRVADSKEKFEAFEQGLGDIERRFQEANTEALAHIAGQMTEEVKTKVDNLYAVAEMAERRVEDSSNQTSQELDHITRILDEAMGKAVAQAEKIEDAALMKLREEAIERVQQIQANIEEELAAYQENAKTQIQELQNWAEDYKEIWRAEAAELESQRLSQRDEWRRDAQEIQDRLDTQREAGEQAREEGDRKIQALLADLKTVSQESCEHVARETARMNQELEDIQRKVAYMTADMDMKVAAAVEKTEQQVIETTEERLNRWKHITKEAEAQTRQRITDMESYSREMKDHFTAETDAMEERLKELSLEIESAASSLQNQASQAADRIEGAVLEDANRRFEQWKEAAEEREAKALDRLTELEALLDNVKTRFDTETREITRALEDTLKDAREAGNTQSQQILADIETLSHETEQRVSGHLADVAERLERAHAELDELSSRMENEIARAEEDALSLAEQEREKWKLAGEQAQQKIEQAQCALEQTIEAEDIKARDLIADMKAALADTKQQMSDETAGAASRIETLRASLDDAAVQAQERGAALAEGEREKWRQAVETEDVKMRELLSNIETSLTDTKQQVADEIAAVTGQLAAIHTKSEEAAAHIHAEITGALDDAQKQASLLAEGELNKWKEAAEARDTDARQILSELETTFDKAKQQMSHDIDEVAGQIKALQQEAGGLASRIETEAAKAVDSVLDRTSTLAAEELAKWKDAAEAEGGKIQEGIRGLETSLQDIKQQADREIAGMTGQIEETRSSITQTADHIKDIMAEAVTTAQDQTAALAAEELEKWREAAEAEGSKIQEGISGLETSLQDIKQQADHEIAGMTGQIEETRSSITQTADHIKDLMAEAVTAAQDQAAALAQEELAKWREAAEAEGSKIQEGISGLETSLQDIKQQADREIAGLTNQIEETRSSITQTTDHIKEIMAEAVTAAQDQAAVLAQEELAKWKEAAGAEGSKIQEGISGLETSLQDIKQQADREIAGMTGQIEETRSSITQTADHIKEIMAEAVTAAQDQAAVLAQEELAKWKEAAEAEGSKIQYLLDSVENALNEAKQQIADEILGAAEQFESIQTKMRDTAGHIEDVMAETVDNAEAHALALAAGELEKWKHAVESEEAAVQHALTQIEQVSKDTEQRISDKASAAKEQLQALEATIHETADHIKAVMAESVTEAEAKALVLADTGLEKWRLAAEEGDKKARQLFADLESAAAETKQAISNEITITTGRFEHIQTEIQETAARIEAVMAQTASKAEESALALTDAGLARWKQAAEEGDVKARQLLADVEQAAISIKQEVLDEINASQGQLEDARRQREETVSRIAEVMAQAVTNGEQKAVALAEAGFEKWNAVLEEMDAKTQGLIVDLNAASVESTKNLTDLEQRLAKISEDTERKAAEDSETQLKACRQAAAETETAVRQAIADLESAFMAAKTQLFDEIAQAGTSIAAIQDHISQARALLDNEMAMAVEHAKEKALLAAEEEDAKIRGVIADLESAFMAAKTQLFDEIAQAGTSIETIQDRLDQTCSHIDNTMAAAVENAEAAAAARADAGLEKWKTAIDEEDAKVRQLLLDLDAAVEENERKMSGLEQRLVKITGDMEQRVLAVTDERLEEWKAITSEAESRTNQLIADLEAAAEEIKTHFTSEHAAMEQRLKDLQSDADTVTQELKTQFDHTARDIERQALEGMDERLRTWKIITAETEANTRQLFADLEAGAEEIKTRFAAEHAAMKQELEALQGYADTAAQELKAHLEQAARDIERQALEDMDERLETWKDAAKTEDAKVQELVAALEASSTAIAQRIQGIQTATDQSAADLEARLGETVKALEQKILQEADAKLGEYQSAQAEQFKRLETLADDTSKMDAELRRYMAEIESRTREAVSQFEHTAEHDRSQAAETFNAALQLLKAELAAVEQELSGIKAQAYQNVSEQFQVFESGFSQNIAQKSDGIERRLAAWQEALEEKLAGFTAEAESQYKRAESSLNDDLRNHFDQQHERFVSDLERLKIETSNFEEGIRAQMKVADDSLASLKDQMRQDIEEARSTAESSVKAEIGRYALSMADSLKQSQRELEAQMKKGADQAEARSHEISNLLETSRQELDSWQTGFALELQKLDASMNDARRRAQELIAESGERLSSVRSAIADVSKEASAHRTELFAHIDEQVKALDSAIKDADRHIKDFTAQTRLFERTDELKLELERRLEDLRGDFDRIDQRRAEALELEGQFIKIKRLEDEVNAKMTRFLSEKHRIEQMETEFSRLLQVSGAVEEKLAEVSNSDDTLQAMQIQLRRLNDALDDTEEKYQRIEKKNQILDTTSDGIDRNFKSLQESEKVSRGITDELNQITAETSSLRAAVQALAEENTRAKEVADKLSLLDTSLSFIEERIEEMQKARQWLARAETRLEELNKESLEQVKLLENIKTADKAFDDRGAPPLSVRENVLKLAKQGWTVDEIARAVKRGRGEVELILELMPKD